MNFRRIVIGILVLAIIALSACSPNVLAPNLFTPESEDIETGSKVIDFNKPFCIRTEYSQPISPGNVSWWESGVEYCRIIELQHSNSEKNGVLLATFEELNSQNGYPIYSSYDRGKTWKRQAEVSDNKIGFSAEWMPHLYELPEKLGELHKGTILLSATSTGASRTANVLYQSPDAGKTWERYSTIAIAGASGGKGIYEPFIMMLDNGELACYYSDETEYERHSQKIVYRTSRDGKTWNDPTDVVSLPVQSYRPGMPIVTKLGDGSYFMVYEIVGMDGNPIYFRTSKDGLNWGDPTDIGTKIESNSKSLGSAPYCAWTPCGGEKGTLIVSGCFMASGSSETGTDYFISNDYGVSWKTIPHPIPYDRSHSKIGYANGFCFSADWKYLYATNNPSGEVSGHSQIMFALCSIY